MKEIWKRLIYQGKDYGDFYEVSNYGDIRNSKTRRIRRNNINRQGYYFVSISLGSREKKITLKNHRAVAETFILNPNGLPCVNHKDANKLNNRVDNLEWCTHSENSKHAENLNLITHHHGCEVIGSKFSEEEIRFIKNNYIPFDKEYGIRALSRKFNVCKATIEDVVHGISYKNIN